MDNTSVANGLPLGSRIGCLNSFEDRDFLTAYPILYGSVKIEKMLGAEVRVKSVSVCVNLIQQHKIFALGIYTDIKNMTVCFQP